MTHTLNIRLEQKKDTKRTNQIIEAAFKNHPHSNQKEHLLVAELRANNALSVSLVAEVNGKIVGHIAFSEVTVNGKFDSWYGLAPVSVDPEYQNQGIGSKLIENGLSELKKLGANGCVLVGEPGYYKRFGFDHQHELFYEGVPEQYFLVQTFNKECSSGEVKYHQIFGEYG